MIGSAAGLGIAALALRVVAGARPASLSALSRVAMSGDVLGLSIVPAMAVGFAVGFVAGGRAMHAGLAHGLRVKSSEGELPALQPGAISPIAQYCERGYHSCARNVAHRGA